VHDCDVTAAGRVVEETVRIDCVSIDTQLQARS